MSFVADLTALIATSRDGRIASPAGCTRVPLGSVARIVNGYPFKSSGFGSVGAPVIRIRDVARGSTNTRFAGPIPEGFWVARGDLVIGMDGDFTTAYWRDEPALLNQRVCRIVPDPEKADLAYLRHVLPGYLDLINEHTPSVTVKHLSSRTLASIPIPLPALNLQRALAARIDALFAEMDDGEAALRRARSDLATWRKALLKAAVTGELTADWRPANPPAETGADLLARILADRRARWLADSRNKAKRYGEPRSPDVTRLPDLPDGWTWASIEQLTTGGIRNGLSVKEAPHVTEIRGLRLDALRADGIDWSRFRHLPITPERASGYLLSAGDLLISRANGSPELVGRCSLVDEGRSDTVFPDTAIRYPLWGDTCFHEWVRLAWSAPTTRKRMLALAKTTAGILKISQDDIAAVPLPLPPLKELAENTALIERMTAEAEAGNDDVTALSAASATLRQSILAAAFRGELAA